MGKRRGEYRILVDKPEGKRQRLRPHRRWEGDIKVDRQYLVWGDMDWVYDVQERDRWRTFVKAIMNLRVIECVEFLE
jgi:hypothetical protein